MHDTMLDQLCPQPPCLGFVDCHTVVTTIGAFLPKQMHALGGFLTTAWNRPCKTVASTEIGLAHYGK